ncbi:MAG: HlyD family efflux transporter periplasmic adaptor subunit [Betaproteobacteria bacterium]|nr:HlyD family efflux transporter periplasmic adaptor subunit [Betaproteobacteria bacterium]
MTQPEVRVIALGQKSAQPLPPLREDLRLFAGATARDGSPTWRILDPVRNSFFEIGWLEFELIARWAEAGDADTLVKRVAKETPLRPSVEEIEELVAFLASNQLLSPKSGIAMAKLIEREKRSRHSPINWVLHHYLFFRVPLWRPDNFLARTVGITDLFFTPSFGVLLAALLCTDLYLLSREWYSFTDALGRMLNPHAFVFYAIAVTFSKIVHEFGHAYAARRYGVRVPTMGVAFLVMWPFLYTDTGETWKLGDHRKQLVIACAGMAAELTLAVFSTLLWALAPEGGAKNVFFVLASTTWIMTLAVNASPFMRFDGYFVLSDLLDFPNLHERGTACAKWWMRKTFFGLEASMPEPQLRPRQRTALILFAYVTWAYRLTVFLGIALLVYHFAFKLLGIFLMMVELVWFIAKPVWTEAAYLWAARKAVRISWKPTAALAAVIGLITWIVPVSTQVTAPAILRAEQEHAVYAPFPARVVSVRVTDRSRVLADAELVTLEAQDLDVRAKKADIGISSARAELARMPSSVRLQEHYNVLVQQLAQATVEKQAVREEYDRQHLRAPQEGVVRDVPADLVPGRWVNTKQLLMRVVSDSEQLVEAYVGERQVDAVAPGQTVRFYPQRPGLPVLEGQVISVDKSPLRELSRPLLASTYGGEVGVKQDGHGVLVTQDAVFRVTIKPTQSLSRLDDVVQGRVRIDTGLRFVMENFVYHILSVLIRESGI